MELTTAYGSLMLVLGIGLVILSVIWIGFNRGIFVRGDHDWSVSGAAVYGTAVTFVLGSALLIYSSLAGLQLI